jgi:hypothetical protein
MLEGEGTRSALLMGGEWKNCGRVLKPPAVGLGKKIRVQLGDIVS